MKNLQLSAKTALPPKVKELIGLGVAAQIPCHYCIIADAEFSKMDGATDAESAEAVAMAAFTRQMSTLMNGMQIDPEQLKSDVARIVKGSQASRTLP